MSTAAYLGIFAGLLQALGYCLYVYMSVWKEIQPNASTWFMFAYGTSLLTVLEYSQGAEWMVLILPLTCAVLGVCVACICWARGTLQWPENSIDRYSFIVDVVLTVCYVVVAVLRSNDVLSESQLWMATLAFLILSNLTAVSSFTPLLRETYVNPHHESHEPWLVWTCAYVVLGFATVYQDGWESSLLLYPAINAPLHAAVAWLSRPSRKRKLLLTRSHLRAAHLS